MLSMLLNEVAPPPPPPPTDAASATMAPALRFPAYLLPSLSRPFRRYRRIPPPPSPLPPPLPPLPPLSSIAPPAHDDASPSPSSPSPLSSSNSQPGSALPSPTGALPASSFPLRRGAPSSRARGRLGRPAANRPADVPALARIQPDTIRCSTCGTDFAFYSQIVSKGFTGRHGRAYLVSPPDNNNTNGSSSPPPQGGRGKSANKNKDLVNVKVGKPETRVLVTGMHVVCDIQCATCRARVGWKYVDAKEETQKYKIGKFILEMQRTVRYRNWDDAVADEVPEFDELEQQQQRDASDSDGSQRVSFDSDDEDDCEDLFAGVWDAKIAARRRRLKASRK
ncbi:putative yippee family protein [Rosellinia necatrix]|uniref:Putative yippee family protein n=1 Tax=Rosellinia necatrix TaxID=77044 RepID=A0A1S7UJ52_ROSNE|nr:putative yippee family protein [Rosellinia necatrix]